MLPVVQSLLAVVQRVKLGVGCCSLQIELPTLKLNGVIDTLHARRLKCMPRAEPSRQVIVIRVECLQQVTRTVVALWSTQK